MPKPAAETIRIKVTSNNGLLSLIKLFQRHWPDAQGKIPCPTAVVRYCLQAVAENLDLITKIQEYNPKANYPVVIRAALELKLATLKLQRLQKERQRCA